jgi:hypothetical protein
MYHRFGSRQPFLTRALHLDYDLSPVATQLIGATTYGIRRGSRLPEILAQPTVRLGYTNAAVDQGFAPMTLADGSLFRGEVDQFVDLNRDGLPGLLCTIGTTLTYAHPLGGGCFAAPALRATLPVPIASHDSAFSLTSLEGDTRLDLIDTHPDRRGYYALSRDGTSGLHTFESFPVTHAGMQSADLSGDGRADLVAFARSGTVLYPSRGTIGYGAPERHEAELPADFPMTQVPSPAEFVGFLDLIGDGGAHVVRITRDQIRLWPSLGRGGYGAGITLSSGTIFGPDFDPRRLHFADADGYGAEDILYQGPQGLALYRNLAGNGFDAPAPVTLPDGFRAGDVLRFADVLGSGTTSLIVTTTDAHGRRGHLFRDLSGGQKPGLLKRVDNGIGLVTEFEYESSTKAYLAAGAVGCHPPSPVQVVSRITQVDEVVGHRHTTDFKHHLGSYNVAERSFEGFALVEMVINARSDEGADHDVAPILVREWYHTGAPQPEDTLCEDYRSDPVAKVHRYSNAGSAFGVPGQSVCALAEGMARNAPVQRALSYALRGKVLRTETYLADDFEAGISVPMQTRERSYTVHGLQPDRDDADPV